MNLHRNDSGEILCIGEILWDALPAGLFLGGAPLNVSLHLKNLNTSSSIISRVGNDRLGTEALKRIKRKGLSTDLIQQDDTRETGFVSVELRDPEHPVYEIKQPVAWDFIENTARLIDRLEGAWGLVYGSLAQRLHPSRTSITRLFNHFVYKAFDLNLRAPHYTRSVIKKSLKAADLLKMNDEELQQLGDWFDIIGTDEAMVRALAARFSCPTIAVTKASKGGALLFNDRWVMHPGFDVSVADTVGAGDAFMAALLRGIKQGKNGADILAFANAAGAFVASRAGATPDYTLAEIYTIYEI